MLKYLITITTFFLPLVANAADPVAESQVYTTSQESKETLLKNNYKKIRELKDKINGIDGVLTMFAKCEAKHKAYLGKNVRGGDKDGCIDIQNVVNKTKSKKPVFKAFIEKKRNGQLLITSSSYSPGNTSETWHRMRADRLCKVVNANYRAMTYDDVKYVHSQIPIGSNGRFDDPHGLNLRAIWLFDAEQSNIKTDFASTQFASNFEINNCKGWTSKSISDKGLVLELKTSGLTNHYLEYDTKSCNNEYLIACVQSE